MKLHPLLLISAAFAASLSGCTSTPGRHSAVEHGTDTVDPTLPTQLPRTAIPSHYAIEVTPHAAALTFDGKVAIDLQVIKPTRELVLNALDLDIAQATLTASRRAAAGREGHARPRQADRDLRLRS